MNFLLKLFVPLSIYRWLTITKADTNIGTMLVPTCEAMCLENFQKSISLSVTNSIRTKSFLLKSFCLKNTICKGCMRACSMTTISLPVCTNNCKAFDDEAFQSCTSSCKFIEFNKINRPGICPTGEQKLKCSDSCLTDADCSNLIEKCCKNQFCGSVCQVTLLPVSDVPPVPDPPVVKQIIDKQDFDQIKFDLDWSNYDVSTVDYPVLFVVQVKVGQIDSEQKKVVGRWRDLIMETKLGVIISSIDIDLWYQFRLLAFSKYGFKDYGNETEPKCIELKSLKPSEPKNIVEKITRLSEDKIAVTLSWECRNINNPVPISNYKLRWRKFYETGENQFLIPEFDINIPGSETQYTIENLEPSTSYRIEIVTVILYRGVSYNSTPAVHYLSTVALPEKNDSKNKNPQNPKILEHCVCGKNNDLPVTISNSTFINGSLSVRVKLKEGTLPKDAFAPYTFNIQWIPIVCIDSNSITSFDKPQSLFVQNGIDVTISGLQFRCNYKIEIILMSDLLRRTMRIWEGCFCTTNCFSSIISEPKVSCSEPGSNIPDKPHNLKVFLLKSAIRPTANAEIHWQSNPQSVLTAFRITWGPRLDEPIDESMYFYDFMPILDSEKTSSKVIQYPNHKVVLSELEYDKMYVVKLQSLKNDLASKESAIFFKVQQNQKNTSDRRKTHFIIFLFPVIFLYNFRLIS